METRENWAFTNCPNYNSALSWRVGIVMGSLNYLQFRRFHKVKSAVLALVQRSHYYPWSALAACHQWSELLPSQLQAAVNQVASIASRMR